MRPSTQPTPRLQVRAADCRKTGCHIGTSLHPASRSRDGPPHRTSPKEQRVRQQQNTLTSSLRSVGPRVAPSTAQRFRFDVATLALDLLAPVLDASGKSGAY